jgi:dephospho-CoA kinase
MSKSLRHSLKLGVTGGIGSGKTTICKMFEVLGIPVFSADDEAKKLQDISPEIREQINLLAGRDLYSTGYLDRPELAKIIFGNKVLLAKINSIIHPVVFSLFEEWVTRQDSPYSVMEAAILFESGAFRMMDRIATVVTPTEERIERLLKGNRMTREQITSRMINQIDDESRVRQSDFVIYNSENDMIIPAVLRIHEEMLSIHNNSN